MTKSEDLPVDDVVLLYATRGEKPKDLRDYPEEDQSKILLRVIPAIQKAWNSVARELEGKKVAKIIFIQDTLINFIPEKQVERIILSERDFARLEEELSRPAKLNPALEKAAAEYRRKLETGELIRKD